MKKNNQAVLVIIVLVIVLVILGVGYLFLQKKLVNETPVSTEESFHTLPFALDIRFFSNQLVVLTADNTLGFYDISSDKLTPYVFPSELFDAIHHFSFSPTTKKAFVIGSKQVDSISEVRYALVDLEKYTLVWFSENVLREVAKPGYRINDIAMDSAGEEFLFSLVSGDVGSAGYELVAVNPVLQSVKLIRNLSKDHSLEYYNSLDQKIVYNSRTQDKGQGIILVGETEQSISHIESISVFPNDIVFGSYTRDNKLAFSSINSPENVRLTISSDRNYPLLSPSIVRSRTGTYTAYHLWKPVTREGIVRVVQTDQEIVIDQPIQGSAEMFFSPDDKKLLLVTEHSTVDGLLERRGFLINLATSESSDVKLPQAIRSIIEWN